MNNPLLRYVYAVVATLLPLVASALWGDGCRADGGRTSSVGAIIGTVVIALLWTWFIYLVTKTRRQMEAPGTCLCIVICAILGGFCAEAWPSAMTSSVQMVVFAWVATAIAIAVAIPAAMGRPD